MNFQWLNNASQSSCPSVRPPVNAQALSWCVRLSKPSSPLGHVCSPIAWRSTERERHRLILCDQTRICCIDQIPNYPETFAKAICKHTNDTFGSLFPLRGHDVLLSFRSISRLLQITNWQNCLGDHKLGN